MKTAREWFEELPEDVRKKAINNSEKEGLDDIPELSLSISLFGAFVWSDTPEGHDFWSKIVDNLLDEGR